MSLLNAAGIWKKNEEIWLTQIEFEQNIFQQNIFSIKSEASLV